MKLTSAGQVSLLSALPEGSSQHWPTGQIWLESEPDCTPRNARTSSHRWRSSRYGGSLTGFWQQIEPSVGAHYGGRNGSSRARLRRSRQVCLAVETKRTRRLSAEPILTSLSAPAPNRRQSDHNSYDNLEPKIGRRRQEINFLGAVFARQ